MNAAPSNVVLVCGGLYHDFDYVRVQLLSRLYDLPQVRTSVHSDYSDIDAIARADALVTYTTDVIPDAAQQEALDQFLERGGRWFALHGTNAAIAIDENGYASSPPVAPKFMEMLGSQFLAHPPKGEFQVCRADSDDPIIADIEPFTVEDELYLVDVRGTFDTLLYARFSGKAMGGFSKREFFSDEPRPILYRRRWGKGEVLYFNLGHCRGHHDMRPLMDWYPEVERGAWTSPVFLQLLQRGLEWMTGDKQWQANRSRT